ncbi:MAG: SpoIIE family protein phosphatase [Deltaproteobacteria bacterium]
MIGQQRIVVEDATQVGEARRTAALLSARAGLSETESGRLAIIVNELGSNLGKHARHGELLIQEFRGVQRSGVEVLSLDRGPGMDLATSMRDGHSTAGTRGEGLGAVRRLADEFDADTGPSGSVVMARIWVGGVPDGALQIGAACQPVANEHLCGDSWDCRMTATRTRLLVVDGLGHGPLAARASQVATEAFAGTDALPGPEAIVHAIHGALRPTRGAALAVAELDLVSRTLRFCGVGNIGGLLQDPAGAARGLVSHNGIGGHEARRIQEFVIRWPPGGILVLHSDGITSHWTLKPESGLRRRHAGVIAGVIFRDFRRTSDDATVIVLREP